MSTPVPPAKDALVAHAGRGSAGAALGRSNPSPVHAIDALAMLALAAGAYALKRHYADAGVEDLHWILAPTARLLEFITASPWPFEAGVGYVSFEHATAIVPACAGVNFLIIATATLVVGFLPRARGTGTKLAWLVLSACVALPAGILTNALRVVADVTLRQLPALVQVHAQVHRILGVVVYLGAACILYAGADRLTRRSQP